MCLNQLGDPSVLCRLDVSAVSSETRIIKNKNNLSRRAKCCVLSYIDNKNILPSGWRRNNIRGSPRNRHSPIGLSLLYHTFSPLSIPFLKFVQQFRRMSTIISFRLCPLASATRCNSSQSWGSILTPLTTLSFFCIFFSPFSVFRIYIFYPFSGVYILSFPHSPLLLYHIFPELSRKIFARGKGE